MGFEFEEKKSRPINANNHNKKNKKKKLNGKESQKEKIN